MAWYTILFIIVFTLFGLQLILSWFFGDVDVDMDCDGIEDADVSSIISFKGILHFLMGVSSYLLLRANMASVEKIQGVAQFGILDYMWAIIVGMTLMILMFFGYQLALKASTSPATPKDLLNGSRATVSYNIGNGQYYVQAHTLAGTIQVCASYDSDDLDIGTEVMISKNGERISISEILS